ncbi:hypothetical protein [Paenibacillus sp. LHD-38]|uniref:hypothetical protein n=1 Tax=Paenibacillus sp. LHD-38 TaxID=3072143 RepID=UPI00280C4BC1|nr:hypothetical protein [Paenibacillus sp. LHD-38]MDQ8734216.1 hypothetical protein [Paenibacillus sp. LHD-38]
MKYKFTFMFLVFLIVLSACSGRGNVEKKLTLEIVAQAMENQGIKLLQITPKGGNSPFGTLSKVAAVTYAIDTYSMGDATDELEVDSSIHANVNVYIFIFDSEQARKEGREDFNNKLEFAKLLNNPSVYEKKNVMVVYFKHPDDMTEYDDMIKRAIEKLN